VAPPLYPICFPPGGWVVVVTHGLISLPSEGGAAEVEAYPLYAARRVFRSGLRMGGLSCGDLGGYLPLSLLVPRAGSWWGEIIVLLLVQTGSRLCPSPPGSQNAISPLPKSSNVGAARQPPPPLIIFVLTFIPASLPSLTPGPGQGFTIGDLWRCVPPFPRTRSPGGPLPSCITGPAHFMLSEHRGFWPCDGIPTGQWMSTHRSGGLGPARRVPVLSLAVPSC